MTIPLKDREALGAVRCLAGLRAAIQDELVWLRGITPLQMEDMSIRQLPSLHTYQLDEQERLFPLMGHTPVAKLPPLSWQPLAELIKVTLPASSLPGTVFRQHPVQLSLHTPGADAAAILTEWNAFYNWVINAPACRLERTRFALSAEVKVLVLGLPLIPLPGKGYTLQENMLLPEGLHFDPPMITSLVAQHLHVLQHAYILFDKEDHWQEIPYTAFQITTRSAVRLTNERRAHEQ